MHPGEMGKGGWVEMESTLFGSGRKCFPVQTFLEEVEVSGVRKGKILFHIYYGKLCQGYDIRIGIGRRRN